MGGRVSTYTGSIQSKTNQPPKLDAVLTTNASLIVGTPISLGVTATDLDYDLLTYTWFVDGKQVAEKTQDYQITYTFATSGTHTITVSVRDDFGGKDSRDYAMQILDNPVIKPPPVPVDPPPNPVKWKKVSDAFSQENNIRFFADGTGWVISMYQAQALRTIDKGVTWQSVALPKSDMGGASGFRDIAFANSKEGWVVGCPQLRTTRPTPDSWRLDFGYGRAGHTTDGGQTWENVEINLPSKGLDCFVAVQLIGVKGWILTSGGELMGTTDAGKNWSLLSRLTTEPSRMQFVDELHGWMINTVPSTTMKLSRTTDGGKTWTTTELPNSSDMNSLMGFSFFDKDTGYVSAQGRFLEPYKLLKTTDGGVTWSELPVHTRSTLGEATFASASVGYVIDGYGAFYKTNDGGLSWNQVAMTPPELADMYPLAVDSQGAWWTAVGGIHVNGGLYKLILP
ncbi:hypothetical protein LT85_4637 [Collimonas arenae]|uniref:PKD/Chitinase domain-containing protein n=1 Tax=Collimonas arenae TaxID=279058 RepID=A0A0A1FJB8_9BURK|nr:hypothetical protein LT85_4637 [Collimonas arenae]